MRLVAPSGRALLVLSMMTRAMVLVMLCTLAMWTEYSNLKLGALSLMANLWQSYDARSETSFGLITLGSYFSNSIYYLFYRLRKTFN